MLTKTVDIQPAWRISQFLVNWQKLTFNQDILSAVKGYTVDTISAKDLKFYENDQETN